MKVFPGFPQIVFRMIEVVYVLGLQPVDHITPIFILRGNIGRHVTRVLEDTEQGSAAPGSVYRVLLFAGTS